MLHLIENAKTPIGLTIPNLRFFAINGESEIKKLKTKTNIFYTIGDSEISGSKRTWLSQKYLPLDFDPTNKTKPLSTEHIETIIQTVCSTLKLEREKTWIIGSGFGVQMMIELDEPISEEKTFKEYKKSYAALCKELNKKFSENNIPAETDSSAFAPNRMMRAPFTLNHKPERGDPKECILISGKNLAPQGSLERLLEPFGSVVTSENNRGRNPASTPMPTTPLSIVKQECAFVKHFLSHPEEVHEPVFKSIVGILGVYGEHNIWDFVNAVRGSSSTSSVTQYTDEQALAKLKPTLEATGNRGHAKAHIETTWEGCQACPNYVVCSFPTSLPVGVKLHDKQSIASLQLYKKLNGEFLLYPETDEWYKFNSKFWEVVDENIIKKEVLSACDKSYTSGYNASQAGSIYKLLSERLTETVEWNSNKNEIPFSNGILTLEPRSQRPFSNKDKFDWCLPHSYNSEALCPTFDKFIEWLSSGRPEIANVLLCFMAAVVRGRYDLQRYLELVGLPGTGKSLFLALIRRLIGDDNCGSSKLDLLDKNQFEVARFKGKKLIVFPDAKGYMAGVDVFKSLTGGDPMRWEQKHNKKITDFVFKGMVIVAANNPIQFEDNSTAISRRRISIHIDRPLDEDKKDSQFLEKLLVEMPGIMNKILKIDNATITVTLDSKNPALKESEARALIETNPIADWLENNVYESPEAKTQVGFIDGRGIYHNGGSGDKSKEWLYPNYVNWCQENGKKNVTTLQNFSRALEGVLLKYKIKFRIVKPKNKKTFIGIALRDESTVARGIISGNELSDQI